MRPALRAFRTDDALSLGDPGVAKSIVFLPRCSGLLPADVTRARAFTIFNRVEQPAQTLGVKQIAPGPELNRQPPTVGQVSRVVPDAGSSRWALSDR